jgi:hypothetical protein
VAHEISITTQRNGKWYNIPSVIDGKQIEPYEAEQLFKKHRIKPLQGPFDTILQAEDAAKRRSQEYIRK